MNTLNNKEEKTKILLVDDKMENLIALEKTLAPLKLNIFKATSGNDALKLMLTNDFSVVLLDVMMPIMDGYEVANLMHENEMTKHIPIMFITALNKSDQSYIHGMEVGAIDYLYKPVDPVVLLSKVRVFVDLFQIKNKLEKTVKTLHQYQTQLEKTNLKLKQISEEDSLTGLANRRHFEERFLNILAHSEQMKTALALIFFDVDNFKYVNDKHGHATGDVVLKTIAKHMLEATHQSADKAVAARLGGDEFAIVIPLPDNNPENTKATVEHLLNAIQDPIPCGDKLINISVSIGVAYYPEAGRSIDDLLRSADIALYLAKEAGKNCYVVFNEEGKVSS